MKMTLTAITVAVATLIATSTTVLGWAVDAQTSGTTTQLYLDTANTILAPTGTVIWFVADLGNNGVITSPTVSDISNIKLGLGGDALIWADIVDGSRAGNQAGKFTRGSISVPDTTAFSNANIYVYLWNVTAATSGTVAEVAIGTIGQTFGVLNLGVTTIPGGGNATWSIATPIAADSYAIIPEPSTIALVGFGLLGAWAIRRRKIS